MNVVYLNAATQLRALTECRGDVLRLLKLRGLSAATAVRPFCEGAFICHNGLPYPV